MRHLINYIIEKFEGNKAYIMTGLPGSGKSTWIKQNIEDKVVVISKDLIRQDMGIITDQNVKAIGAVSGYSEAGIINNVNVKITANLESTDKIGEYYLGGITGILSEA